MPGIVPRALQTLSHSLFKKKLYKIPCPNYYHSNQYTVNTPSPREFSIMPRVSHTTEQDWSLELAINDLPFCRAEEGDCCNWEKEVPCPELRHLVSQGHLWSPLVTGFRGHCCPTIVYTAPLSSLTGFCLTPPNSIKTGVPCWLKKYLHKHIPHDILHFSSY